MVFGGFIAQIPNNAFIAVHLIALSLGLWLANKQRKTRLFPLLIMYAFAELSYLLYHIPVFNMLFSHVLAETFLLVGVILATRK